MPIFLAIDHDICFCLRTVLLLDIIPLFILLEMWLKNLIVIEQHAREKNDPFSIMSTESLNIYLALSNE